PIDDPGRVRNAWPSYLVVTATAAVALLAACWIRDPAFVAHTDWRSAALKLAIYLVYGPIQAIAFFGYVQTRLRAAFASVMPGAVQARLATAAAVAGLFALAHAPNWPLAGMTLTMGLVWSWLFWARPNVLLLGASHAVLGTITYSVLHLYTRIGPFYAHPEGHIVRAAIPGLQRLVGDLF
ncbi:MAG TPA: CPBP family glutamic-type intramembrane protease, partial [Caulobacteraceae bacterium]|nr:CPBP family glutamic-type intramembrane protease [Caulobacteraceae bacterium]